MGEPMYSGSQYINSKTPLWASALSGAVIGPDIQVSTLTANAAGAISLNAQGTFLALQAAPVVFNRSQDEGPGSHLVMTTNLLADHSQRENISIVNNTGIYYEPIAVESVIVYGATRTTTNIQGQIGIIGQFENTSDVEILTTGLHTSSLWVSSINGQAAGGGGTSGPDILVSTIGVNALGHIEMTASGTAALPAFSYIQFDNTPEKGGSSVLANQVNIYPAEPLGIESLAVTDPIGNLYKPLAVGELFVFGTISSTTQQSPPIATFQQSATNTNLEVVTSGFYTSSLLCSSINGQIPGGGGAYNPNLLLSTLEMNYTGTIILDVSGNRDNVSQTQFIFQKTKDQPNSNTSLAMTRNFVAGALGVAPSTFQSLSIVSEGAVPTYDTLTTGNLMLYGLSRVNRFQEGQIGLFQQWSNTQDIELITTGFHTSSIVASTIQANTISISTLRVSSIVDYSATISSVVTQNISTAAGQFGVATAGAFSTNTASIIKAITSSLSFNASLGGVNLGGVDLGMGGFLGGLTGQLVTGATSMTIAGAALATGAAALLTARTASNVYLPGQNSNSFNVINSQTQLQFSTLGTNVSSFLRFTSSMAGSDPSVLPAAEVIVYSKIIAGTPCVRSLSDPLNPINPSTCTSTLQSFGPWQALPQTIPLPVSTVTQDFVVQSTLTAYKENISTTLNVQGVVTGGTLASLGTITAGQSITAALNIVATNGFIQAGTVISAGTQIKAPDITATTTLLSQGSGSVATSFNVGTTLAVGGVTTLTGNLIALSLSTTNASVSTMNVSTINGLPFIPGGGVGQNPTFSTVTVGQAIQTSTLQTTQAQISTLDVSSINANYIYTTKLNVNQIDATLINAVAGVYTTGSNTLNIGASGVIVPNGQIIAATGQISSIIASGNVIAKTISTQGLFVSSVNGILYPPPLNPIYNGNLIVNGNLTVASTIQTSTISASRQIVTDGVISATGTITSANIITGASIVSLGSLAAANAVIGGIILGPGGVENAVFISASNINVSTINGTVYPPPIQPQFSTTIGDFNIPSPYQLNAPLISTTNVLASGTVYAQTLQATNTLAGVLSANAITCGGTVAILGGSLYVGGTTLLGTTTITGPVNAASISTNSLEANTATILVAQLSTMATNNLQCTGIAGLSSVTAYAFKTPMASISSITNVSTINGIVYPPPNSGTISSFSTIFVSSLRAGVISTTGSLYASTINAGTISSVGNIATGGSLNVLQGSVNCGAITCTGSISANFGEIAGKTLRAITSVTAASGTIGGTILGPSGVINASALTLSQTLYASTITTNSFQASNITAPSINTSTLNVDFINILGSGSNNTIQVNADTAFNGLLINDDYSYLSSIVVSGVIGGAGGSNVKFITPLAGANDGNIVVASNVTSILGGFIGKSLEIKPDSSFPDINASIDGLGHIECKSISTISDVRVGNNLIVNTIVQADYTRFGPSTLTICGNVKISSLDGLISQGPIEALGGIAIVSGGLIAAGNVIIAGGNLPTVFRQAANFSSITTMNGGATVNGLTTMNGGAMIYSGATIIGPTYIPGPLYINSIAPSTITSNREFNTGLNALSAGYQPTIGNPENSGQNVYSDPTNPYLAQRITGATLNTSFYTVGNLPSGGTTSIPGLMLWSVTPAHIQVYAYCATTNFSGAWEVYGTFTSGVFYTFITRNFEQGLTLQNVNASVPCRLPIIIQNTGGSTAVDIIVSWVIFPLTN